MYSGRTLAMAAAVAAVALSATACGEGFRSQATTILDLVNAKRAEAGCGGDLITDAGLATAAERQAADMRDHPFIYAQPDRSKPEFRDSQIGSDNSTVDQRIAAAGFTPASKIAEIAYVSNGTANASAAVEWWASSPALRDLMLNCDFTHAGVGVLNPENQNYFAVVDLGRH